MCFSNDSPALTHLANTAPTTLPHGLRSKLIQNPPWDPNAQFRTAIQTLLTIFPPSVTLPIITQSGKCIAKVPLQPPIVTLSCKATASLIYTGPSSSSSTTTTSQKKSTGPKTINPQSLLPAIHSAFNAWTFEEMNREEDEYNEWKTVEKVVQIGDWKVSPHPLRRTATPPHPHAKPHRAPTHLFPTHGSSRRRSPSEPSTMRALPLSLSLLSLSLPHGIFASPELLLDCASDHDSSQPECMRPMKPVATVTPGAYYIAKIPCPDCKVQEFSGPILQHLPHARPPHPPPKRRAHLPLSPNKSPSPPHIHLPDPPNFTRTDLASALACARKCRDSPPSCSCLPSALSTPVLNFDHNAKWLDSSASTQTEKWEITFDAIGATNDADPSSTRGFTSPEQPVLRIILQGKEVGEELPDGHNQGASPLTGPYTEPELIYDYEIASIEFSQRYADVPTPRISPSGPASAASSAPTSCVRTGTSFF
ncbi:hypothetical protein GRF29_8g3403278 [Pseudopithomyces chartarum]|uniref:Uncharacterized protein n=1 Tax=Pseudopithomyces chartarum TaxID=1892770 RepID=A0AAN6M644_9PLEO|nr:hypothetical protein GRF29_8g3403278 [Pseudopithomyces chartarum]